MPPAALYPYVIRQMPYSTVVVVRNWNLPSLMVLMNANILVGIAGLIKCDVSCYAVNLYILKGVADGGGIGGACVLYGLDGSQVGIVTQGGDSRDNVFLLFLYQVFLEALDEGRSLVVSRFRLVKEGGDYDSLRVGTCVLDDGGVLPCIAGSNGTVIPSSLACLMINGAVVMEDGAKMMSGLAAFMLVRMALKSVWFVWNCSSLTMLPPNFAKASLK